MGGLGILHTLPTVAHSPCHQHHYQQQQMWVPGVLMAHAGAASQQRVAPAGTTCDGGKHCQANPPPMHKAPLGARAAPHHLGKPRVLEPVAFPAPCYAGPRIPPRSRGQGFPPFPVESQGLHNRGRGRHSAPVHRAFPSGAELHMHHAEPRKIEVGQPG